MGKLDEKKTTILDQTRKSTKTILIGISKS